MPKILSDLKSACIETLSSDPSGTVTGRFWYNSTDDQVKTDNGTNKRALLRNDAKCIIGSNGSAVNNVRFHRGANSVIQFVKGSDSTSEGSLSTLLAETSSRTENYTNAGKPAAANAGRLVYLTDLDEVKVDNGATYSNLTKFNSISPLTTKGDLVVHNGTINTRIPVGTDGFFLKAKASEALGVEWGTGIANVTVRSVITTDTQLTGDDDLIFSDPSFTFTLLTAIGNTGKTLTFIHAGTSLTQVYTIDAFGAETIAGSTTVALYTNGEVLKIRSNGANWYIVEHFVSTTWISAGTVTIDATTLAPTKGTATIVTDEVRWRRDGSNAHLRMVFRKSANGTATSGTGDYKFGMPTGLVIDTSLLVADTTVFGATATPRSNIVGNGHVSISTTSSGAYFISVFDSGFVSMNGIDQSTTGAGTPGVVGSGNNPLAGTAVVCYSLDYIVPISGWLP